MYYVVFLANKSNHNKASCIIINISSTTAWYIHHLLTSMVILPYARNTLALTVIPPLWVVHAMKSIKKLLFSPCLISSTSPYVKTPKKTREYRPKYAILANSRLSPFAPVHFHGQVRNA